MDLSLKARGISTPQELLDYLSKPQGKYLPFPSPNVMGLRRFHFREKDFYYHGRSNFSDFVALVEKRSMYDRSMCVVGPIGNGKSHLLAAYVLYMRYLRSQVPETHRVVYIPRCSVTFSSGDDKTVIRKFIREVSAAFSDNDDWNTLINNNRSIEWSDIESFFFSQDSDSVILVYDDWNYMLDEDKSHVQKWKDRCECIAEDQFRVEVVSANSPDMRKVYGGSSFDHWYRYDGSLKNDEWEAWCVDNPLLRILKQKELDQVRYMTGGQPLLMDMLATPFSGACVQVDLSNSENNLAMAIDHYYGVLGAMGYAWIYDQLAKTTQNIVERASYRLTDHIEMMTRSLAHLPISPWIELFDHRFFHHDPSTRKLNCFCGFAEDALRHLLYKTQKELYMKELKALWADPSMLYSMNPFMCGFAFEELVLAMLSTNYHLVLPEQCYNIERNRPDINVTLFKDNYPSMGLLNREGIALYRPNKWNLQYVDAVLRVHVPRQDETKATKRQKRQPGEAIRVTVVPPTEHSSSLQFYTRERDGLPDCDRYARNDEDVQHHFVWIIPKSIIESCALPPGPKNVQQHIRTIEAMMSAVN